MSDRSDWITTREAAERMGINVASVSRLCLEKKLDAVKPCGRWRIDPASVKAYSDQGPAFALDLKQAKEAASLYLSGDYSMRELARLFGTTTATIDRAWDRHADQLPTRKIEVMKAWWKLTKGMAKITPRKVQEIRTLKAQGKSNRFVAYRVGIDKSVVSRIHNDKAWSWVP